MNKAKHITHTSHHIITEYISHKLALSSNFHFTCIPLFSSNICSFYFISATAYSQHLIISVERRMEFGKIVWLHWTQLLLECKWVWSTNKVYASFQTHISQPPVKYCTHWTSLSQWMPMKSGMLFKNNKTMGEKTK